MAQLVSAWYQEVKDYIYLQCSSMVREERRREVTLSHISIFILLPGA